MPTNRATRRALKYRPATLPREVREEAERTPPTPYPNTPRRKPS